MPRSHARRSTTESQRGPSEPRDRSMGATGRRRGRTAQIVIAAGFPLLTATLCVPAAGFAETAAAAPPDGVPPPAQVREGLLARYRFDECTVADSSGHALDGVVDGSLGCGEGFFGAAFVFDGHGYPVVDAEALGATTTEPRTVSLWVKPTSLPFEPGAYGLISKYRHFDVGQSNYYAALYQRADGQIVTRLTGNGTNVVEAEVGTLNEWQHYVFVVAAGSDASEIYRNGSRVASGTLTLNETLTTEPLRIGNIVGADDQLFRGTLDDVRIYDRVLTKSEIRWLGAGPPPYGPPS